MNVNDKYEHPLGSYLSMSESSRKLCCWLREKVGDLDLKQLKSLIKMQQNRCRLEMRSHTGVNRNHGFIMINCAALYVSSVMFELK